MAERRATTHTHDEIIKKTRDRQTHTQLRRRRKKGSKWPRKCWYTPLRMKLFFSSFFLQQNSAMLLFSRLIIILVFSLGCMAFLFTSSRRVSFCFSYPLVTMIPTSCESAESKLMMVFDTVMAELFLSFFLFFFKSLRLWDRLSQKGWFTRKNNCWEGYTICMKQLCGGKTCLSITINWSTLTIHTNSIYNNFFRFAMKP